MATHPVALVPLYGREGLRSYSLIDEDDRELVAGQVWSLDAKGYARRDCKGVAIFMHQLILGLTPGTGREQQGDHRNRNRLDIGVIAPHLGVSWK